MHAIPRLEKSGFGQGATLLKETANPLSMYLVNPNEQVTIEPRGSVILVTRELNERVDTQILPAADEVGLTEIAEILKLAAPLVALRMDRGDLPALGDGTERRAKIADVLALQKRLEAQRAAVAALADDTDDLIANHGL